MGNGPSRTRGRVAGALFRRWYVVLLVWAFMAPAVIQSLQSTGVYWSRVEVVFLPPAGAAAGNPLRPDSANLVHYAAMVQRQMSGPATGPSVTSTGAALYGTGIREGHSVSLPSAGGQWQTNFNRAVLVVEVVAASPDEVGVVLAGLVDRIEELASAPQDHMGVASDARITTWPSPEVPAVHYAQTRLSRAVAALVVLALGLALSLAIVVDRVASATRVPRKPINPISRRNLVAS